MGAADGLLLRSIAQLIPDWLAILIAAAGATYVAYELIAFARKNPRELHTGESRPRAVSPIRAVTIPANRSSEKQANAFAASFLMPEHIVRQFSTPAELAAGCHVSQSAAEIRMRELMLWPKKRPPIPEVEEYLRKMKAENERNR